MSPSSLCEKFNSLWSRPEKLALNSKSRICRISEKKDNLVGYTQFPGNFRYIRFSSRNFQNFWLNGSLLGISTISGFSGNFLRKFPYHDFGNLGRMESAQGQPCEVIQIFGNFLLGIIVVKLNFLHSGILVWMVRFADFVFLPDFLENVHRKFPYQLSPFLNFSEFEVGWKTLLVLEIPNTKARLV